MAFGFGLVLIAGRRQRLDPQAADLHGTGLDREAELALVLHMVGVRVGPEHELRLHTPLLRRRPQGGKRRSGIHVESRPTLLVGHEVGVREITRMQAPFDEHGGTLPATPAMRRN